METQDVLSYQSLGVNRTVALHYNSLHADPRRIVRFKYPNYQADGNSDRLVATLTVRLGNLNIQIPTQQWALPATSQTDIIAGIAVDLGDQKTGVYQYDLKIGLQKASGEMVYGSSSYLQGQIVHVNTTNSQFGSGWGLVGLQELAINPDKSVLWVDGDGSRAVFARGTTVDGITGYSASVGDYSKFEKLADGTYRRTLKDRTVSIFDGDGKLQTVTDREGNVTTYSYSGGKLSQIIDPQGLKTTFAPNEITSPDGRKAALYFDDGDKNLTSIRYADDTTSTWVYDNLHHIKRVIDQNGNSGTDEYDQLGRVRAATRKDGSEVTIQPAEVLGVVLSTNTSVVAVNAVPVSTLPTSTKIDGEGNVEKTTVDQFGQTVEVSDKVGKKLTTNRDRNGNVIKSIDGEGNITSYTYDDRNNLTGITHGDLGNVVTANVPPFDDSIKAYPIANNRPTKVATGDINGDGIDDVVTVTSDGKVNTFLGHSDGILTLQQTFSLKTFGVVFAVEAATVKKVTIADINGDGVNDLVIGYNKYNSTTDFTPAAVTAFYGTGSGANKGLFTSNNLGINAITNTYNSFDNFSFDLADFVLGDFNGDGKLDIASTNAATNSPNLSIFLSGANGGYAKINTPALRNLNLGGYDSKLAVGDFNLDGKQDLVVATASTNASSTNVSILTSVGDGTFTQAANGYQIPGIFGVPKVADLNKDGKLDIVINAGNLGVLLGTGGTNFQLTNYGANGATLTELGDIDKDGNLDIVTVDNSQRLRIFAGKDDGTFATAANFYTINATPRGLSLGDLNGDGKVDVAIADLNAGLNIKLNQFVNPSVVNTQKTFTYDTVFNQLTSITDELGRKTIYQLDSNNGNRLSETRVVGTVDSAPGGDDVVTNYTYNNHGQILTMTDAKGNVTTYDYSTGNALGQLASIVNAAGDKTSYTYDAAGNRTAVIDANQHETDYTYDKMNRLKETIGAQVNAAPQPRTKYDYYKNGQIKSVTDPNGHVTSYEYDELDRLTKTTDGEGNSTTNHYDKAGNVDYTIDGKQNKTEYEYDDRKRLIKVINPDKTYRTIEYYLNDLVKSTTDENQHKIEQKYDSRNRLVESIDANSKSTFYTYDDASQLKEIKDARGKVTKYAYDDLGRKTTTTAPIDSSTTAITPTEYDKNGNITAIIDANGNRTEYQYDALNRRTQTKDALTKVTSYDYDKVGNLKVVTDANNRATNYQYDALNRQSAVINAIGQQTDTTYDLAGNIKTVTAPTGHVISYGYDNNNRRTTTSDERGVIQTVEYNQVGQVKTVTDAIGNKTTNTYDNRNRLTHSTDDFGADSETKYDNVGNITTTIDAQNHQIGYQYDVNNRRTNVTKTVNGATFSEKVVYDEVGNILSSTDGENHTTTYVYDDSNRRIQTIDPLTHSTYTSYDKVGNITQTTDIYGNVTETVYSDTPGLVALSLALELPTIIDPTNIGKTVRSIDANGHSTLSVYDLQGHLTDTYDGIGHRTSHQTYYNDDRIKTITDTFGQVTTYTYQDNLRQITIVDPLGVTTTKKYDKVGNLTDTTDSQNRTTRYDYDELNRQKTITDAVGGITTYTYYNDGKTKTITDAANNITTYSYDAASRLTKETTALGDRVYGYDEVNNQTSVLDRDGRTTTYGYDNLNRVKTETWGGSGKQFTYTYDQNSNRLSADDGSIKYNYSYDNTDLLTQVDRISGTNPTVSFQYEYDKVGNLTESDELTGTTIQASTGYTYDSRNLNTEIVQTGTGLVSKLVKFSYDAQGQTAKIERYANGQLAVTTTDTYDTFGRLTGIKQENSTGVIANSLYEFDNLNRLTSETIDGVNRLIGYDKIDQVKTVTGSNSEAYTYDANGNRTNNGYVTGANNQLVSDGTYNYQYDAEGNRTKRTNIATNVVDEYVWDYRNRLTTVTSKDAGGVVTQTVGYEYDVDDQRVSKTVNGVVEKYIIDRNQIAYVTDGSGTQTFHYLYGTNVDAVMAQDSPTGMVWSLSDRLGSVNLLADAGGVVVDQRTFDSFGRVLSETNPGLSFRYGYTGRETDGETGLDYYRARYYDAGNGRFISVDPIGFGAGDTNLYRYVGNSSTNATDPSGEWINFVAGGFIGAGLDLGIQLLQNGGKLSDVHWDQVAISGIAGAVGGGIGGALGKGGALLRGTALAEKGLGLGARTAINAGVGFNTGYYGKVAENAWNHQDLTDGALATGIFGGLGAGAGELAQAGIGKAWSKYAGLKSGIAEDIERRSLINQGWITDASGNLTVGTSKFDRFKFDWKKTWNSSTEEDSFQHILEQIQKNRGLTNIEDIINMEGISSVEIAAKSKLTGGKKVRIWMDENIGSAGGTDNFGNTIIDSNLSYLEQTRTMFHENVHSFLSPYVDSPFAKFRTVVKTYGYEKVQVLRYTEEALAETYALVKTRKIAHPETSLLQSVKDGLYFPFKYNYNLNKTEVYRQAAILGGAATTGIYTGYEFGKSLNK